MGGPKDEIPDLFPSANEPAQKAPSVRPAPPVRGSERKPPAPVRSVAPSMGARSVPSPPRKKEPEPPPPAPARDVAAKGASPAPQVAVRAASKAEPEPRATFGSSPLDDFGEFDVVGAASQRATELVNSLSLDFGAKEAPAKGAQPPGGLGGFDSHMDITGESLPLLELAEPDFRSPSKPPPGPATHSVPRREEERGPSSRGSVRPASQAPASVAPASVRPAPGELDFSAAAPLPAPSKAPQFEGFGFGGQMGSSSFDLDAELGLTSGPSELAVQIPLPHRSEDDTPWPTGRTPEFEEHDISAEKAAEVSGFGPKPTSFVATPLYALRVELALRQLESQVRTKREALENVEFARDVRLAELAESVRTQLSNQDRFARLYTEVSRYEELEAEHARVLRTASDSGSAILQTIEDRAATARTERSLIEQRVLTQQSVVDEARRATERALHQKKRIEIEKRNIENLARERVQPGAVMPADLAARFLPIVEELKVAEHKLKVATEQESELRALLRAIEEEATRARALEQKIAGEREAFLLSHEGEVGAYVRALDETKKQRIRHLASAGCAILALRGEVGVDKPTRLELLAHDEVVRRASHELSLLILARGTLDSGARAQGKTIGFTVIGLLVLALVVLIFR